MDTVATLTPPPRVLQVVLSLNAGGTERLVIELTRRLREIVPMAVCCLDEEGEWASEVTSAGVKVEAIGRRQGFDAGVGREIHRVAQAHRATVLHCHQYSPFVYGCLARLWGSRSRVVFTEHGRLSDAPPSWKRRAANLILPRFADRVFAVSAELRQHLIAEGFSSRAVGVIYNGVDLRPKTDGDASSRVRAHFGFGPGPLVIGSVGRLDPVKDLRTLILATADVRRTHPAELLVIGDGPERSGLETIASECGLKQHVHFLGYRRDARDWLAGCDVYVNSSVSEGVSLTILEAMAAGLPVVATRVGGTPEIVDSTCGMLVPPRQPLALAGALLELARDRERRSQLGRAARQRVEERFTLDRMIQQYCDVYRAVA